MDKRRINDVLKDHADELMAMPGVEAVAVGESCGKRCIIVFVADISSSLIKRIPDNIEGFRIMVEKSGKFQALGQ